MATHGNIAGLLLNVMLHITGAAILLCVPHCVAAKSVNHTISQKKSGRLQTTLGEVQLSDGTYHDNTNPIYRQMIAGASNSVGYFVFDKLYVGAVMQSRIGLFHEGVDSDGSRRLYHIDIMPKISYHIDLLDFLSAEPGVSLGYMNRWQLSPGNDDDTYRQDIYAAVDFPVWLKPVAIGNSGYAPALRWNIQSRFYLPRPDQEDTLNRLTTTWFTSVGLVF